MSSEKQAQEYMPDELKQAWEKVSPSERFGYTMNGRLVALLLTSPAVIWAYFLFVVFRVGFSLGIGIFIAVYVAYTAYVVVVLMRWRAFCLTSGVVVGRGQLIWSHGGPVHKVRWRDVDPKKLGLEELGQSRKLEASIRLTTTEGKKEALWLFRPFGLMQNLESFVSQLLDKSRRAARGGGRKL